MLSDRAAELVRAAISSADEISARLVAGKRPTISDVEDLRNHVRKLAAALEATASPVVTDAMVEGRKPVGADGFRLGDAMGVF